MVIKSNVISVKDEIQQPKILGKIDLSPKPKAAPPAPKAEAVKTRRTTSCGPALHRHLRPPKRRNPQPAPAPAPVNRKPVRHNQPSATQASHAAPAAPAPAAQAPKT